MAEEVKENKAGAALKTLGKILIGIALIVLGGYLCIRWWPSLFILIQGCLGPFLILVGLVFIAIAKE